MTGRSGNADPTQDDAAAPRLVGRSRHGEFTLDQIAGLLPGLGQLMPQISQRYWIMYYAAHGGNWRLALYCAGQIRAVMRVCGTTRPKMREHLETFEREYLRPLEAALRGENIEDFDAAYQRGIDGANHYHAVTGHPEIIWQLPPTPPEHLYLGPIESGSDE